MYLILDAVLPAKLSASNSDDSDGSETLWSCSVVVQEKPYDVIEFGNSTDINRNKGTESGDNGQQQKHLTSKIDSQRQKLMKLLKGVSKGERLTLYDFINLSATNRVTNIRKETQVFRY